MNFGISNKIFTSLLVAISILVFASKTSFQANNFSIQTVKDTLNDFCGSTEMNDFLLDSNPLLKIKLEQQEEQIYELMQNGSGERILTNFTLPVVVHIIHDNGPENISDAQILQGIQHLNESFANVGYYDPNTGVDTEIQFCLAKRDPEDSPSSGITRDVSTLTEMTMGDDDLPLKNLNRWQPLDYINIWVVREICTINNGCGVAGYAYLPYSHGNNRDGIVIEASWFGSSPSNSTVLTHEMGHYLGLYHTFKGGCTNDNCLTNGDRVCDTPPDQSNSAVPCNAFPNSCNTDVNLGDPNNPFTSDQNDMFWNYMDYGGIACFSAFTAGQAERMEYHITGPRGSLLISDGCNEACMIPIVSLFVPSEFTVSIGSTVDFVNQSSNATTFEWLIDGVLFSNAETPSYTFPNEGLFEITLNATNADPNCFESYAVAIEVVCPVLAEFIVSDLIIPINETVNFSNLSSGANDFEWFIDGVLFSTDIDASMAFSAEGTYEITLDAILDDPNCSVSYSIIIEAICPVEADFTTSSTIIPANETITFTNTSANAINYEWFVNDISQGNSIDFSLSLNNPGVVQVCLEASDPNCTDIHCEFISITTSSEGCYHTFEKTFGTEAFFEGGNSIIKSLDGNLFLTGYQGDKSLILKITPNGEVIWQRAFKFTDHFDRISEIIIDSENNIVGCGIGTFTSNVDNEKDGFAFKYDYVNNTMLWVQILDQRCQPFNIIEPSVGADYILTANSHIPWSSDNLNEKALIFELDRNNGIPTNNLGFSYFTQTNGTYTTTILYNGALYANGHFIDEPWNQYQKRNFLSKLDLDGNVLWSKFSFLPISGSGYFIGRDIIEDGSNLLMPISGNHNYFSILKTDINGNLIWLNKYSDFGFNKVYVEELISIADGYVIYGNVGGSGIKLFLLKTDKNGELQWLKYFDGETKDDANPNSFFNKHYQSQLLEFNGHLYFTGSFTDTSNFSIKNILLIKTDMEGNTSSECEAEIGSCTVEAYPDPQNTNYNILKEPATTIFATSIPEIESILVADSILCSSFCIEICDNGRDDDGDLLVDYYDPDCPCEETISCGTPFYDICTQDYCENPDTSTLPIEMDALWSSFEFTKYVTGVIGDIDGDCIPDIVSLDTTRTILSVINSNNGSLLYSYTLENAVAADIAIGDVDLDGMAEIFVNIPYEPDTTAFIYRFDYNPTANSLEQTWQSSETINIANDSTYSNYINHSLAPALADFDYNGIPEVYAGNYIFDSQTGQYLVDGGANNIGYSNSFIYDVIGLIAVDVLSDDDCVFCQGLELVAGGQVYTVNIASYTVASLNSMNVEREIGPFNETVDGLTSIVDFDRDGDLDAIILGMDIGGAGFFIWDLQNEVLIGNPTGLSLSYFWHSPPHLIDIDNDGWPEVVVSDPFEVIVFEDFLQGGGVNWGGNNPATIKARFSYEDLDLYPYNHAIFDLNGDGAPEIITSSRDSLFVFDGDLNIKASYGCFNNPGNSNPIIADLNGDGETELLCHCRETGLTAIKSANIPWVNSRKIWNQSNYFVANVNDDGTIPVQQQQHHIVGDSVVMNNFLVQQLMLNDQGALINPLADAYLNIDSAICNGDAIDIFITICNEGDYLLSESTPLALYFGDPTSIDPNWSNSFSVGADIKPDSCFSFFYSLSNAFNQPIFIVANDDLSGTYPFDLESDFPFTSIVECDYSNNMDSVSVTAVQPPELELGPDIFVCDNAVFEFNAGVGFDHYEWQDGSGDSSYTSYFPGEYWVAAWNECGVIQRDTVQVQIDSSTVLDLGPDIILCDEGESVSLSIPGFDNYQWFPSTGLDCDTCRSVTATPFNSTTYTLVANSESGCISVDSVSILINEFSGTPITGFSFDANCFGESNGVYQIDTAFSGFLFSMDGVTFQNELIFSDLSAGDYTLFVEDPNGCQYFQYFSIEQPPQLIVGLPEDLTIELGDSIIISSLINVQFGISYNWDSEVFLSCSNCHEISVSPVESATYSLTITDSNGCQAMDEIFIEVENKRNVFIPNVFSPNSDGTNDKFIIFGGKGVAEILSFKIFDRLGEPIFEVKNVPPNDAKFGWDGTFKGKEMSPQVFIYMAEISFLDGISVVYKGDLTLIK